MNKRILFVDHDSGRTGSTVSLEYLVKAFCDRDYTVFVLSPKRESEAIFMVNSATSLISLRNGRFISIVLNSDFTNRTSLLSWKGPLSFLHEILKLLWGILIVGKTIKQTSPHLVYVNEHAVVSASIAAYLSRIPAAIHIRSPLLKGVFGLRRNFISRLILTFNQVVIAITRIEAEQLKPRMKHRKKIRVVGEFFSRIDAEAINENEFRKMFSFPRRKRIVSMLGGILSKKGTIDFLRAAERVEKQREDVLFVIAGKSDRGTDERAYFEECMHIVNALQQKGAITMLGEITNSLDLIAASDIIVSPSPKSHFSRPVIEAWGFAKPVIATKTDHMQNLITHGLNGLLVDAGDNDALARSLCQLLDDVELRKKLGSEGKKKADTEFDADKNLEAILKACESLINA